MDADRFDRLAKVFFRSGTRRRLIGLLTTAPVLGALAVFLSPEGEAEHPANRVPRRKAQYRSKARKERRKRRNQQQQNQNSNDGGGGGGDASGGDRVGTCGTCPPGTICTVNGSCAQPCTTREDCGSLTNTGPCAGCSATNTEGTAAALPEASKSR